MNFLGEEAISRVTRFSERKVIGFLSIGHSNAKSKLETWRREHNRSSEYRRKTDTAGSEGEPGLLYMRCALQRMADLQQLVETSVRSFDRFAFLFDYILPLAVRLRREYAIALWLKNA